MWATLGMPDLLRAAQHEDEVFLPMLVPGWQGAALAVAGAALGEWWAVSTKAGAASSPQGSLLGWAALTLILVGLLVQMTRLRTKGGWAVNLAQRRLEPRGLPGQVVVIDNPEGYTLACVAGDRFRSVAIDLQHVERGRVARLLQTPARTRLRDIRACSVLTDHLAQRLGVARGGLVA